MADDDYPNLFGPLSPAINQAFQNKLLGVVPRAPLDPSLAATPYTPEQNQMRAADVLHMIAGPDHPEHVIAQMPDTSLGQRPVQEAVTGMAKETVDPLLSAGNYVGGMLQGSQRFNWPQTVQALGGVGSMLVSPEAPAEEALVRGAVPALERVGGRIGQRLPTNIGFEHTPDLRVDIAAMKAGGDKYGHVYPTNVDLMRDYPGTPADVAQMPHDQVVDALKQHFKDNLRWLYDQVPDAIRARAAQWYDGGSKMVQARAQQYGLAPETVAGIYARLSPGKHWFSNVGQGDRVLDIYHNMQNAPWDDAMTQTMGRIYQGPRWDPLTNAIGGKTLSELQTPYEKAAWIRLWDEAHNSPQVHDISPEGVLSAEPGAVKVNWQSNDNIGKAVAILESGGDAAKISDLLSNGHKIRNFYNNLLDPNALHGDVTIDTHAVGAAHLRPLSQNSREVEHNFGTSQTAYNGNTGIKGLYPVYADAYRELASELGILPRQLQSITWEAQRSLFPRTFKRQKNIDAIDTIWHNYRSGNITADEARAQVYQRAGAPDIGQRIVEGWGKPTGESE